MKEQLIKTLKILVKIILILVCVIIFYAGISFLIKTLNLTISALVLEYIKVLIWPSVIFVLIFTFRSNFSGLLDRLAEFSLPGGVSGKINPQVQQQDTKSDNSIDQNLEFTQLLTEKENQITAVQISNDDLKQKLSTAEIELDFERIYSVIFASQIDLLLKMNNFENVEFSYVDDHFKKAQQVAAGVLNEWNTSQYINFLINNGLIEYPVGTAVLKITLKGKVFLSYLSVRNYKKYGI